MTLGTRLKRCRTFRGITQQELGEQLGYAKTSAGIRINQYEKESRHPKQETIMQIARCLDISPYALLPFDHIDDIAFMEILFWMEEFYHQDIELFSLSDSNALISIMLPVESSGNTACMNLSFKKIQKYLKEWQTAKRKFLSGAASSEDYFDWKIRWHPT